MRKFLIPLLLASAAASPAIAGPRDWSDRQQTQEDRQQSRDDRQQAREERSQARDTAREERAADRASFTPTQPRQQSSFTTSQSQQQFVDRAQANRADHAQQQSDAREQVVDRPARVGPKTVRPPTGTQQERLDQLHQRLDQRQQDVRNGDLRQSAREVPNVMRNPHPPIVSDTPRQGTQPPLRTGPRTTPSVHWNTNWRNDHHYDWNNYRHHHHWLFHLGFYNDPYGWGYSPFQIGWRLWPSYYGNNYWINDPWMYRLPYAPPGYVWIRYWNDALLVDTWTGTVVDMIPGFFW